MIDLKKMYLIKNLLDLKNIVMNQNVFGATVVVDVQFTQCNAVTELVDVSVELGCHREPRVSRRKVLRTCSKSGSEVDFHQDFLRQ